MKYLLILILFCVSTDLYARPRKVQRIGQTKSTVLKLGRSRSRVLKIGETRGNVITMGDTFEDFRVSKKERAIRALKKDRIVRKCRVRVRCNR